jgi:hypothetical protein
MNQRSLYGKKALHKDRQKLLEEQGFVFDVEQYLASAEGKWETDFSRVRRNLEETDFQSNIGISDYGLRSFLEINVCEAQRGLLSKERARRLIGLGYSWVEQDEIWKENFEKVCHAYDMKGLKAVARDNWLDAWLRMHLNMSASSSLSSDRKKQLQSVFLKDNGHSDSGSYKSLDEITPILLKLSSPTHSKSSIQSTTKSALISPGNNNNNSNSDRSPVVNSYPPGAIRIGGYGLQQNNYSPVSSLRITTDDTAYVHNPLSAPAPTRNAFTGYPAFAPAPVPNGFARMPPDPAPVLATVNAAVSIEKPSAAPVATFANAAKLAPEHLEKQRPVTIVLDDADKEPEPPEKKICVEKDTAEDKASEAEEDDEYLLI